MSKMGRSLVAGRADTAGARTKIMAALEAAGVASAHVGYDGQGDEGSTGDPIFMDARGLEIDVPEHLAEAMVLFAEGIVDAHVGDFSNDEGGEGSVRIEVAAARVLLDRGRRSVAYDYIEVGRGPDGGPATGAAASATGSGVCAADEERRQIEIGAPMAADKARVIALLASAGIATAEVEYFGQGDEGDIHEPRFTDAAGEEMAGVGEVIVETVTAFCESIIEGYVDEFRDGDGGKGSVMVDVSMSRVLIDAGVPDNTYTYTCSAL